MTIFKNHKADLMAAGSLIGGWYTSSPIVFYGSLGYLSNKVYRYLFSNQESFNFKQTNLYKNIRPYVPNVIDTAIESLDDFNHRISVTAISGLTLGLLSGMGSCSSYIAGYAIASIKRLSQSNESLEAKELPRHNHESWLVRSQNQSGRSVLLIEIADENRNIVRSGGYETQSKKKVFYTNPSLIRNTRAVNSERDLNVIRSKQKTSEERTGFFSRLFNYSHNFDIYNMDCLYAYEQELKKGHNPVLLNNANGDHAGGGYLRGTSAQEEDLLRRIPDLYSSLDHIQKHDVAYPNDSWFYRTSNSGCIYTPGAKIARRGRDEGYKLLEEPISIDIITSAAPNLNQQLRGAERDNQAISEVGYEKFTKDKMFWQIKTAIETGHDTLIISAWGCGAFGNNPEIIARYYREVYNQFFKDQIRLVFPILDDRNGNGNLAAFKKAF